MRVRGVGTDESAVDNIALRSIDGLDTSYCDDFVCTSSPSVEQTVRSLARELQRGRYSTLSLYQRDVQYSDGFRSFTGPEGYTRQRWIQDNVTKPKGVIVRMSMLDKGTSKIEWRLEGTLGPVRLDIGFTTICEHNLLTGRVTVHRESWDLSRCALPASALATLNRMAWSAKQIAGDTKDGLSKAGDKLSNSMQGGGGGGDGNNAAGPGGTLDPTKFYQQPENGPQQDYFAIGMLMALLYLASRLWSELELLG